MTQLQRVRDYLDNNLGHIYAERNSTGSFVIYHYYRNSELQIWEDREIANGLTRDQIEELGVRIGF